MGCISGFRMIYYYTCTNRLALSLILSWMFRQIPPWGGGMTNCGTVLICRKEVHQHYPVRHFLHTPSSCCLSPHYKGGACSFMLIHNTLCRLLP